MDQLSNLYNDLYQHQDKTGSKIYCVTGNKHIYQMHEGLPAYSKKITSISKISLDALKLSILTVMFSFAAEASFKKRFLLSLLPVARFRNFF
jgi:hypothetical protein